MTHILEVYRTYEEWELYKKTKHTLRKNWEKKILKGFDFLPTADNDYSISQNTNELFTVALIEKQAAV